MRPTFLKAHWESIAATDFFTVEVFTLRGLVTHYVLFVLDLASRAVKIAGITTHPHEAWMMQMVRNLTDDDEPFLRHTGFLIMHANRDWAGKAVEHWDVLQVVPAQSANNNSMF